MTPVDRGGPPRPWSRPSRPACRLTATGDAINQSRHWSIGADPRVERE